ncbi:MAG: ferritin-like domain-containing protein [Myxococcales bacterium]|nr:ferritin-like domain-containing protein [Myxococcales bacterium]
MPERSESEGASRLARTLRARAARLWATRGQAEREAGVRLHRLAERLRLVGATDQVIGLALAAARDEDRHAELCDDLGVRSGGRRSEGAASVPEELAPAGLRERERVLYDVVALACLQETLSATLLGAMVERATEPRARAVLAAIQRDEARHGRFGWLYLSRATADEGRDVVGMHLPFMLRRVLEEALLRPDATEDSALADLGAIDAREREQLCLGTARRVVLAGLGRHGVDTSAGERWLDLRAALTARR